MYFPLRPDHLNGHIKQVHTSERPHKCQVGARLMLWAIFGIAFMCADTVKVPVEIPRICDVGWMFVKNSSMVTSALHPSLSPSPHLQLWSSCLLPFFQMFFPPVLSQSPPGSLTQPPGLGVHVTDDSLPSCFVFFLIAVVAIRRLQCWLHFFRLTSIKN